MKTEKNKLLTVLNTVRLALSSRKIVDDLRHFYFTGSHVVAYDDIICVRYPFESDELSGISVPAEDFYKVVNNLPDSEITITYKDNKISLKAGKTKASIKTQKGENIALGVLATGIQDVKNWDNIPKAFVEGLGLCVFSVSADMTNLKFTGVFVLEDAIYSTDHLRISRYIMPKPGFGERSFLIPGSAVSELLKFPFIEKYAVNDKWVFFKVAIANDGSPPIDFCVRRLDDREYPDLDDFCEWEGMVVTLPETIKGAVETALAMANGETEAEKLIQVEIDKKVIRCRGENDRGWIENELDIDLNLERMITFQVNPEFLLKVIGITRDMTYMEGRAKFETPEFCHVMAIR